MSEKNSELEHNLTRNDTKSFFLIKFAVLLNNNRRKQLRRI